MRSANLSVPLKGFRPYNALIGLNQASGLAGGPDYLSYDFFAVKYDYAVAVTCFVAVNKPFLVCLLE